MSNQSNSGGFIEKSQKEKKELLAQFLDMNVFEELYQIANDEIRELSALLKDYKNQNFTEKLSEAEDSLVENKKLLSETQTLSEKYAEQKTKASIKIESLLGELISVDSSVINTDNLIKLKLKLEENLDIKSSECKDYADNLADLQFKLNDYQSKFNKYDLRNLQESNLKYQTYVNRLEEITSSLDSLNTDIEHKQEHLDGIGSLSFDDDCEHCVKNQNTPFAKKSKTLSDDIKKLTLTSNGLDNEIIDMKSEMIKYDVRDVLVTVKDLKIKVDDYTSAIEKVELQTKSCNLELTNLQTKISNIESDIQKSIEQKESVEHNAKIQIEIDKHKHNLKEIEQLVFDTTETIIDVSGDVKIAENTIKTVNDSINRLGEMERKYEGYEYYLKSVKRDGIPYELISEVLPKLEVEINNILQPLVDFQILLNTDGKNINSYIAYGDDEFWPLELTSGMEKFISSVAIRTALTNVSNLPRPNFIAIDEGFGSLDSDNFNSLYLLFDYLKHQFDFIVTISHIDKTRDMVDQIIDISKVDGFSSIRYL